MPTQAPHRQSGFTLIELLVSLVVFAALMLTTFQLFNSVLDANERSEAQMAQQNRLATTWAIIFQDILQLRSRTHRDIQGDTQSAYSTSQEYLAQFIRGGLPPIKGVIPGGMQLVAYRFEEGKLYRLTWPSLDLATDSEPTEQLLIGGLQDVIFEHLDNSNNYQIDWPPAGTAIPSTNMPRMIRITMKFDDDIEISRILPGIST